MLEMFPMSAEGIIGEHTAIGSCYPQIVVHILIYIANGDHRTDTGDSHKIVGIRIIPA